jgi:prophage DNA circulation protein
MANSSTWKKLVDGTYKGFTFSVAIPQKNTGQGATREELTLTARNQVIVRPGVNGAEIVNMGLNPGEYTVEVVFFGDSWSDLYDQFTAVLVDPNPGKLVLPTHSKAVTANFHRMSALAQVGDGNAKTCTVTWIQNETTDQSAGVVGSGANPLAGTSLGALASVAQATTSGLAAAQSAVQGAVNGANAVISASGILQAINAGESALSTVRRFSNTVLALSQGIRNRIIQIQANITSTMALAEKAIGAISGNFGVSNQTSAAVAGAAAQASTASSSAAAASTPTIDPDTGQLIVPNNQPSTPAPAANPLAAPPVQPDTGLTLGDLTTTAAMQSLSNQMIDVLQSQSTEMNGYLNGMTSDVSDALIPVINAIQNFIALATASTSTQILTESELSLAEVMFYNGIGLDQLRTIHEQNPQILDPAVIPSGTVVNL